MKARLALERFAPSAQPVFWLKKMISFWLMPLPWCVALCLAGAILLLLRRRIQLGRRLIVLGVALLLFFSNRVVSALLLHPLESQFAPIPEFTEMHPPSGELRGCRYVVVLGGGHRDSQVLPALSRLSSAALGRLTEAVRIMRVAPEAKMIVSGPAAEGNPSHASVLAQAAISLGVSPARIQKVDTARDTAEEAQAVLAIAGHTPVALVTSAWHMPRAVGLFRHAGVTVIPCPADFGTVPDEEFHFHDLGWDVASLERSTWAVHERLGLTWAWLRRQID